MVGWMFLMGAIQAQDHQVYHQKYDLYRERFQTYFIAIGEGPGKSIPFGRITQSLEGNQVLILGESTFLLGTYIGFLGTEYRLYKRTRKSVDQTIRELFFALKALNRLDYWAETYNGYQREPRLDGFFVREDIPNQFCPDSIYTAPQSANKSPQSYQTGSGQIPAIHQIYDVQETHCFEHTPMSQDHMIRILWGLYLAHECLEEGVNYQGRSFIDSVGMMDGY